MTINVIPINAIQRAAGGFMLAQAVLQVLWHAVFFQPDGSWVGTLLWLTPSVLLGLWCAIKPTRMPLFWAGMWSIMLICHGISDAWLHADVRLLACLEVALALAVILLIGKDGRRRKKAIKAQKAAQTTPDTSA